MRQILNKKLHILIFLSFFLFYLSYFKNIYISFWDEICWVGKSYHFDLFVNGDFDNPLWEHPNSYDQPKLGELFFGMALYPQYLIAKAEEGGDYDYIKFLIDRNIYYFADGDPSKPDYGGYIASRSDYTPLNKGEWGSAETLIENYGAGIQKTIDLIYSARAANSLLAALAVVVVYSLSLLLLNKSQALMVTLLFGLNHFFIETSLMAHSEALFYLLFIYGLFLLIKAINKKELKIRDILAFSVVSGLSISTKLNGAVLLIILNLYLGYLAIAFFIVTKKINLKLLKIAIVGNLLALIVFVLTNPFVFRDPLRRTYSMFRYRQLEALDQQIGFPKDALLTFPARIISIFDAYLLHGKEFSYPFSQPVFISTSQYFAVINTLIIIFGFVNLIVLRAKKDLIFISFFFIVLTSMGFYLLLAWPRYYAPLLIFFMVFQGVGLYYTFGFVKAFLRRISSK